MVRPPAHKLCQFGVPGANISTFGEILDLKCFGFPNISPFGGCNPPGPLTTDLIHPLSFRGRVPIGLAIWHCFPSTILGKVLRFCWNGEAFPLPQLSSSKWLDCLPKEVPFLPVWRCFSMYGLLPLIPWHFYVGKFLSSKILLWKTHCLCPSPQANVELSECNSFWHFSWKGRPDQVDKRSLTSLSWSLSSKGIWWIESHPFSDCFLTNSTKVSVKALKKGRAGRQALTTPKIAAIFLEDMKLWVTTLPNSFLMDLSFSFVTLKYPVFKSKRNPKWIISWVGSKTDFFKLITNPAFCKVSNTTFRCNCTCFCEDPKTKMLSR